MNRVHDRGAVSQSRLPGLPHCRLYYSVLAVERTPGPLKSLLPPAAEQKQAVCPLCPAPADTPQEVSLPDEEKRLQTLYRRDVAATSNVAVLAGAGGRCRLEGGLGRTADAKYSSIRRLIFL